MVGQEDVIADITPIVDSVYVEAWEEWIYNTVGYDTTYVTVDVYDVSTLCDTMYFHAGDTMANVPGRLKVVDPYTAITIAGFNGGNGIWVRDRKYSTSISTRWRMRPHSDKKGAKRAVRER